MGGFSLWHWIVVLIIILVLFGRGRVSDIMGEFGKGITSFKKGMTDEAQASSEASPRIEAPVSAPATAETATETARDTSAS
jgi:sec-independent protein translocase protein TatA